MTRLSFPVVLAALAVFAGACSGERVAPLSPPPPPAPQPATSEATDLAALAASLMADVRVLADDSLQGRRAGTDDGRRAAAYVERRFREVGLRPAFADGYRQPVVLPGGASGTNLVGVIEGTVFPQTAIVLTAHYDHLGVRRGQIYNGADDNASGVAGVLALAERLRQSPPQHTVIVAALDGEEIGLLGAKAFVEQPPVPLGAILANVNLDMVSRGDGGALWVAGPSHYPFLRPILDGALAGAPVPISFGHDTGVGSDNWTGASDHAPFHQQGVPFVYFGVEDHPDYHEPSDDWQRIDPAFFAGAVESVGRAVEALDQNHAALMAGRR